MNVGKIQPQQVGALGERIAANYLINQGFLLLELNCRNHVGEIDIIMRDSEGGLCFVEVKTVCQGIGTTPGKNTFDPRELVNKQKIRKLNRAIEWYRQENNMRENSWRLDAVMVYFDQYTNQARCEHYDRIVLDW